jgi:bis(5'-nucleosyl)-tetraphosphatase (symmetrical)
MATYAVGDIQGCFRTLERLLAKASFSPGKDRVWLVGDLVNRGPLNVEVLRWAVDLGESAVCVLGNHDLHLLARAFGVAGPKKRDTLEDVLGAPDKAILIDWLLARPFLVTEQNHSLVHAGFLPQWTLAEAQAFAAEAHATLQREPEAFLKRLTRGRGQGDDALELAVSALTRIRTCSEDGRMEPDFSGPPSEAPPGFAPWFSLSSRQTKGHRVVFGHWAALGLSLGSDWAGIDTGCVWGQKLTALRLEDGAVFQEDNAENTR